MKKRNNTLLPLAALVTLPLLSGCVSDAASMQIEGKEHSITIVREQKWFWDKSVNLFVVVTRMPKCQRRHVLKPATVSTASVEVFAEDANTFFLRQGGRVYAVETQTCEKFEELKEAAEANLGMKIGTFREKQQVFQFEDEPEPEAPKR